MLSRWFNPSTLPEQDLVLAACRSRFTGHDLGDLVVSADPLYSIQLADELGVLGIVSSVVQTHPAAGPMWTHAWASNAARNAMLVAELRRWVLALRRHGFEPIVLKGPALAKVAFGNISHRDSCDLDLIVPLERFFEAADLFRSLGATSLCSEKLVERGRLGALTFEVPCANNTYTLDVHAGWVPKWGSLPERRIPDSEILAIELGGLRVGTLGPKLMLIQSASHFFQHFFSLKNLMDVIATLRYVRRLGLEPACEELARSMGLTERWDRARLAADEFIQFGQASSIPWKQGTQAALALPTQMKRAELHTWWDGRRISQSLVSYVWQTIWPDKSWLSASHEWVGPEHLLLRRFLRPFRLATKTMHALLPLPTTINPAWRKRASQNLPIYRPMPEVSSHGPSGTETVGNVAVDSPSQGTSVGRLVIRTAQRIHGIPDIHS